MADPAAPRPIVLTSAARRDIHETLIWSEQRFGKRAAARYRALLQRAIHDVAREPERPGSQERPELARGLRTYHLFFSRNRTRDAAGVVGNPRHFLVYRLRGETIEVVRVLHDARDLERHLPGNQSGV